MEFLAIYAGVMLFFAFLIGGTLGDGCGSIVAAWLGLMLLGLVFAGARWVWNSATERFGEDVAFGAAIVAVLLALIGGAAFVGAITGSRRKDK